MDGLVASPDCPRGGANAVAIRQHLDDARTLGITDARPTELLALDCRPVHSGARPIADLRRSIFAREAITASKMSWIIPFSVESIGSVYEWKPTP
jgi:hypothetical protein